MNSENLILSEKSDGIMTLRMNRPDKKNALTSGMYQGLADALRAADSDGSVRVVLITGSGDSFTSGNDLADFMGAPQVGESSPVIQFLLAISECQKPLVAAVNGLAVGVGVTMLLHCDLVYAARSATFQMPFVNLGLCPEAGSTLLLPRIMGHQRAAELLLLGEVFSAEKGHQVGIITDLFPDEELYEAARRKALQVAAQPAAAVRLAKSLLKREYVSALRQTIFDEGEQFMKRLKSPEAAEALTAFMERRKPDFTKFS